VKVQWAMRVTDEERASEQPPQCRKTRDGIDKGETTFLSGSTYSVARATPVRAPRVGHNMRYLHHDTVRRERRVTKTSRARTHFLVTHY